MPPWAPLKQLGRNDWLLELFHGPTLAFKDYALQLLGRLFDHVLSKKGRRVTIVGATSGDTGSAAIEACRDRAAVDIIILHPRGPHLRGAAPPDDHGNLGQCAQYRRRGDLDDCQDMVKAMFNDQPFRDRLNLSAVNSINWARIMAQIVYYMAAGTALGAPHRAVSFAVPTGNFGNVYAAFAARRMGLPINQLVVGSNSNDILTRFFESGRMSMGAVVPTLSPSMDIQVSSNFERYLFDLFCEDGARVRDFMERLRRDGVFDVGETMRGGIDALFQGYRLDDTAHQADHRQNLSGNRRASGSPFGDRRRRRTGAAARPDDADGGAGHSPCRQFPDAVEAATGVRPALPERSGRSVRSP